MKRILALCVVFASLIGGECFADVMVSSGSLIIPTATTRWIPVDFLNSSVYRLQLLSTSSLTAENYLFVDMGNTAPYYTRYQWQLLTTGSWSTYRSASISSALVDYTPVGGYPRMTNFKIYIDTAPVSPAPLCYVSETFGYGGNFWAQGCTTSIGGGGWPTSIGLYWAGNSSNYLTWKLYSEGNMSIDLSTSSVNALVDLSSATWQMRDIINFQTGPGWWILGALCSFVFLIGLRSGRD